MVKETELSKLKQDIELIRKNETEESLPKSERGVFLFISFDLADSTAFKTEHPSLWSSVFANFYEQVLEQLGVENYKSPEKEDDIKSIRKLWKLIGDEVLLYAQVVDLADLYAQVSSVNSVLSGLMDKIADKVEIENSEQPCKNQCIKHCQNIKDVILSTLGIKVTMWIAGCRDREDGEAVNIVYRPLALTPNPNISERIDFLGRDIDEGFRMAKYAVKGKIIVSPLLAWLIWKDAQKDEDKRKIVNSNFRITSYATMKGVWRNRKVPIVMFHQKFDDFKKQLAYDELELETFSNIKECGFDKFKSDDRFSVDTIDKILENIYRKKEADQLYKELDEETDITMLVSNRENMRELHIACIVFDAENNILVHTHHERGLEFGCIKNIFGADIQNWKAISENGYREKYKLEITLEENPIPVATYYYEKSNALGVILIAKYVGGADENKEWKFYSEHEIQNSTQSSVEQFKENVNRAVIFKQIIKKDSSESG